MQPLSRSVQNHLVHWQAQDWPIDWKEIFGREAELVLEVGFGNGEFLAHQARAHPDRDYVGIELSWSGMLRLFKRLGPDTANVRALLVDAEFALQRLFERESIGEVFVNHPCPWPKARHHRRRIFHPEGLALLTDRMRPEANLTVVTDHQEYAEWTAENLGSQQALVSRHDSPEVTSIPDRRPTKYERKAMAEGISIHYFEWKRARPSGISQASGLAPRRDPIDPMPSIRLAGVSEKPFEGFEPQLWRESHDGVDVVVRLTGIWERRDAEEPTWLVDAMVHEDRLRQDFGVLVVERAPGELLLRLSDHGRPHPTHGVRRALFALSRWILERHPEAALMRHNLGEAAMMGREG